MDDRLKQAITRGQEKKANERAKLEQEIKTKEEIRENKVKSYLPAARDWVNTHLFNLIAERESQGNDTIILDNYIDGILSEAVLLVVKEISGLTFWTQEDVVWEDADYGKVRELRHYIKWTSKS